MVGPLTAIETPLALCKNAITRLALLKPEWNHRIHKFYPVKLQKVFLILMHCVSMKLFIYLGVHYNFKRTLIVTVFKVSL